MSHESFSEEQKIQIQEVVTSVINEKVWKAVTWGSIPLVIFTGALTFQVYQNTEFRNAGITLTEQDGALLQQQIDANRDADIAFRTLLLSRLDRIEDKLDTQ